MFKDLETLNNTINLTQMDKDTTDHLTLSDLYAFAGGDKKAIRFTHIYIDFKDIPETFYIYTEIGKVIMPRHLNSKLDILLEEDYYVNLMNRGELGIQVYRYQYENRHGYSAKFVRTPAWGHETSQSIKSFQAAYSNWSNGWLDPYEECECTKTPCFEHDCDLCPYNPYQE